MIRKMLIANRGEIACRIIRTARRMKIKTVAIYSESDKDALHVEMADEAHYVGPSPAKDSYLNIPRIIEIIKTTKADAVHPGYGFLSENAEFAEAVESTGAIFIGPSSTIIRDMGDKLRAKAIAREAGIPLIPGSLHPVKTAQEVKKFAHDHGYPILLKAAAGGGGKGMRIVYDAEAIEEAISRTRSEALSSFGDDRIFIEKFIEHPRHIEIQVLGDSHGNIVHLGERDCSLQRRHQKVVEETSAPNLATGLRDQIIEQALKIARHIGYESAGTIEFVVAPDHQFYFLEVNTRLQVEHPVTESVYGVDLVELMILVAAGQEIPFHQESLQPQGHAIEVRLYAEDADNDFLPSSGHLIQYCHPVEDQFLRIDSGIREGDNISIYYDPMIAKVIVHAPDRKTTLKHLQKYLGQFIIEGIECNLNYLQRLLADPDVMDARLRTNLIEDKAKDLLSHNHSFENLPHEAQSLIACTSLALKIAAEPVYESETNWVCTVNDHNIHLSYMGAGQIKIKDKLFITSFTWVYQRALFECQINDYLIIGKVQVKGGKFQLTIQGQQFQIFVEREHIWSLLKYLPQRKPDINTHLIRSPMPGVLLSLHVTVGDKIKQGQAIAVIEAMKMENTLKAPAEGVITEITAIPGESLLKSQVIARFE